MHFLRKQLNKFLAPNKPLPLQLDLTNACNLRCKHCYHSHHNNDGNLSLEDFKEILRQYCSLIDELGYLPRLILCGGEPLISPYFHDILAYAQSLRTDWELSVLTNGTKISNLNFEVLKPFKNVLFQVSLDGPDSERHDFIRGRGSFERSLAGIRQLQSQSQAVQLAIVLSSRTRPQINEFFLLADRIGVRRLGFTRMIALGTATHLVDSGSERPLLPFELKSAYSEILYRSAEYKVSVGGRGPLYNLLNPRLGSHGRPWEAVIIDYQGYMLASSRSRLRLGNVLTEGMGSIFYRNPILKSLRRGKIQVCGSCKYYRNCGGDRNAAFAQNGDFLGHDPGCWFIQTGA